MKMREIEVKHIINYYFEKAKNIANPSLKEFFERKVKHYASIYPPSKLEEVYQKDKSRNTITKMVFTLILNKFLNSVTLRLERSRVKILYRFSYFNFRQFHEDLLFHAILEIIPDSATFKRVIEDKGRVYLFDMKKENFEDYETTMNIIENLLYEHIDGFFLPSFNVIAGRSLHIYRNHFTDKGVATIIVKYPDAYDGYLFYRIDHIVKNLFAALPEKSFKKRIFPSWTTHTFILKDGKFELYCPYCEFYPACARKSERSCFSFFRKEARKQNRKVLVKNVMDEIQRYVRILFKDFYFNEKWNN